MARFECTNEDCSYSISYSQVRYINHYGQMVPDVNMICPDCGCDMEKVTSEQIQPNEIKFAQGRFNSMNEKEQKEVLKKRAKNHFNKHDKAIVEQKRNDAVNSIKEQFTKNVKR